MISVGHLAEQKTANFGCLRIVRFPIAVTEPGASFARWRVQEFGYSGSLLSMDLIFTRAAEESIQCSLPASFITGKLTKG
jgi:hypothetical protein